MFVRYYDKVIRGTESEDALVIGQFMRGMIGKRFSLLNYYKEIPVSYDAKLLSFENEMAEFEVHEYQSKVITMERKCLIYAHEQSPVPEDIVAEAFYVNIAKKRAILCKFGYAKIRSDMRRFVRVVLDRPVVADLNLANQSLGNIVDISLGGAAMMLSSVENLSPGTEFTMFLKLPDLSNGSIAEVGITATIIKIDGENAPYTCYLEFHPEKHSQQQIAYFINLRQVEIIKELKELSL